jgi:uncharacterized protein (DUF1015 family)
VPGFEPFPAVRYRAPLDGLDDLIAPPYDVLSPADLTELETRSPHNIVHVDVPREEDGPDRYRHAADLLASWIQDGVMAQDSEPSYTIYRMRFTDASGAARDISGVLGGLEVVDLNAGGVLPHERTTPKASTDRLDLTRATQANLSPVWGLSLAKGLTAELAEPAELCGRVVVDEVEHVVERVSDPMRIQRIREILAADDVLIADGHHRYSISRTYRDEIRATAGGEAGPAEYTLTFVSELVADQLSVEAIHRVYRGVSYEALCGELGKFFTLSPADNPTPATLREMVERGALYLYSCDEAGTGYGQWLTPHPEAFQGVRDLDGAYLEHALEGLEVEVSYQHGLSEVLEVAGEPEVTATVLIRPVSVAEIERTARQGLLMPPKSTFFTPKLRTGFVVRPLWRTQSPVGNSGSGRENPES